MTAPPSPGADPGPAPSRGPLLGRRTALAGGGLGLGLAGLALSGCGFDLGSDGGEDRPRLRTLGELDVDEAIVVELVAGLRQAVTLVRATRRRHPALAAGLAPLQRLERTHLEELRRAGRADRLPTAPLVAIAVPAAQAAARRRVLTDAGALRTSCFGSADRAESGPFARLLAGMGAAYSQRLAVLAR